MARGVGSGLSSRAMAETLDSLRAALEDRLRFETLIADLSARFVKLDSDLIDGAIQDAQRRIVEALDLDRSSLFQFSDDAATMIVTHYWSRPGFAPLDMTARPVELFPWATAQLLQGQMICFSSLNDLPPGIPDRANIERLGTKSNITLPLQASGRVVGALAFGSMRAERQWPAEIISRLSLVAQVFANTLLRPVAVRRPSHHDLRGTGRRWQSLRRCRRPLRLLCSWRSLPRAPFAVSRRRATSSTTARS